MNKINAKQLVQQFIQQTGLDINKILSQRMRKPTKVLSGQNRKIINKLYQKITTIKDISDRIKNVLAGINLQYKKINIPQDKTQKQKHNIIIAHLKTQKRNMEGVVK